MERRLRTVLILTVSLLWLIPLAAVCLGATYYVDVANGDDVNPGTAESTAWRTIGKANQELQAGDTVYIREGTYEETIRPGRSGTEGNYITYARYNNENAIISGVTYGANLDDRNYIIIDRLTIQNVTSPVSMFTTNHCIVQNCTLRNWTAWAGIYLRGVSCYNKILNNYLSRDNTSASGGDIIVLGKWGANDVCQYNLIEGNIVTSANYDVHAGIHIYGGGADWSYISKNIIRDNIAYNIRRFGGVLGANLNLFENNIGYNMGHNPPDDPGTVETFRIGGKYNVFRNNVIFEHNNVGREGEWVCGTCAHAMYYAGIPEHIRYAKLYHNVIWNLSGYGALSTLASDASNVEMDDNVYKNNILYNNGTVSYYCEHLQIYYRFDADRSPPTDIWDGNLIMGNVAGGDVIRIRNWQGSLYYTLTEAETDIPAMFLPNNIEGDPQFVDTLNNDFHLQKGSPCIDAGVHLARTTGAGTGTMIPVDDAGYFIDGWNIVEGDIIQLEGQTQTARVTNVDYDNNILTLDTLLSWTEGQGVSLAYSGSAPDIGAYEYVSASNQPPLANAGPDQTVTDSDRNGSEQVTLDGSGSSDPYGTIVSLVWTKGATQITTGVKPIVTLSTGTHLITLTVTDNGSLTDTDTVTIKVLKEGEEFGRLPTGCYNNVINPLKGEEAIIVVEIKEQGYIKIVLYDAKGNKIREVADEEEEADIHRYSWNGKDDSGNVVGSGVYFVHIQAGDYKATKKIVVIK